MKISKGLFVAFIAIILGSCFDPPEFPNVPEIAYNDIEFLPGKPGEPDSLVVRIDFRDGDGDLGLSSENIRHISFPYNSVTYYQAVNEQLVALNTNAIADTLHLLEIPNPSLGRLVFPRTRKQAGYEFLPAYPACEAYEFKDLPSLLVAKADTAVLDEFVKIVKKLSINTNEYYLIQDTLYYTVNPNHYNIEVDFLLRDASSTEPDHPGYREFDWRKEYCTTFDGRFPMLADDGVNSSLDGTLRYSMESRGFIINFGINTPMKLRIQIKDRALNLSNVIFTPEFTLDQI